MEFASQLLEIQDEEELEQFLGSLLGRAASAAGKLLRSDAGRALTQQLKDVARKALPAAGRAVGRWVAGDGRARGLHLGLGLEPGPPTHTVTGCPTTGRRRGNRSPE